MRGTAYVDSFGWKKQSCCFEVTNMLRLLFSDTGFESSGCGFLVELFDRSLAGEAGSEGIAAI